MICGQPMIFCIAMLPRITVSCVSGWIGANQSVSRPRELTGSNSEYLQKPFTCTLWWHCVKSRKVSMEIRGTIFVPYFASDITYRNVVQFDIQHMFNMCSWHCLIRLDIIGWTSFCTSNFRQMVGSEFLISILYYVLPCRSVDQYGVATSSQGSTSVLGQMSQGHGHTRSIFEVKFKCRGHAVSLFCISTDGLPGIAAWVLTETRTRLECCDSLQWWPVTVLHNQESKWVTSRLHTLGYM